MESNSRITHINATEEWLKDPKNIEFLNELQNGVDKKYKTNEMKVKEFIIQESVFNKKNFILIAKTECGKEFVVGGKQHAPTYLELVENSSDVEKKKAPNE